MKSGLIVGIFVLTLLTACGTQSHRKQVDACARNMHDICGKAQTIGSLFIWREALTNGLTTATRDAEQLYGHSYNEKELPRCPSGGRYTVQYIFTDKGARIAVRCSIHGAFDELVKTVGSRLNPKSI